MPERALLIDEQFLTTAQNLISRAQRSIYIATFKAEMTSQPRGRRLSRLFDTIIEKSLLGLDIRFIFNEFTGNKTIPFTNLFAMQQLKKHNINVRCLPSARVCHAKLIIVDGQAAIIGSHNLSVKSCHNNFEVSVYIDDYYTVPELANKYCEVWDAAKKA